ncbi:MAG: PAS domain S-box protein [Rhodocyclaceae bacterium]|nr:PAS domain S-box protein [Rhodocyclaceae bacterium]
MRNNATHSDSAERPDASRRLLYGSVLLAAVALVALLVLGVQWWTAHEVPDPTGAPSHAASMISPATASATGAAPASTDTWGLLTKTLAWVLGIGVVGLTARAIIHYRRALAQAQLTTRVTEFNQSRLMDFIELSSDWLWETDTSHRFTLVSSGIRSIANMNADDYIGRTQWELEAEPMTDGQWAEHRALLERHAPFTLISSRGDLAGAVRHLEFRGRPLFEDGAFAGYRGVGRDVTTRVNAERHLSASEERYRTLIESFFDWYWEQDANFCFTHLITSPNNPQQRVGANVIGQTRWALARATPDAPNWAAHVATLQRHEPFDNFIYRRMAGEQEIWFSVAGRPVFDAAGRFTGYRGVARDVTREQHTLMALKASENRYRTTFELAPQGLLNIDAEGRCRRFNPAFTRLLGYPEDALVNRHISDLALPEDGKTDQAMFEGLRSGRYDSYVREQRYRQASGREIWANVTVSALREADGALKGAIAVFQDITPRIASEQDRKAIAERYRRLVDVSPDGIILHRAGVLLFGNRAAANIFGVDSAEALVGQKLDTFWERPHPRPAILQADPQPGTLIPREQLRFKRQDGGAVDVETTSVVVQFDDGPAVLSVVRDISERLAAERALNESRTRYREVVESVNEVIFQIDAQGRFLFLNQAWQHVTGHATEDALGRPLLDYLHPDDRRATRERIALIFSGALSLCECEVRIRTTTGEIRWLEVHARLMVSGDGDALGAMGSMDDITERKVAELTLKNINKELEARVRARTAELEASNRELEAFSYSVSHDLRAPLRAIDGFSVILQEDLGPALDPTSTAYLKRIRSATARMAQLIDDLIELARLTRQTLRRENLDLSLMVSTIIDDIRQEDPGRRLETDIALGLTASADRALMRVVLENLLRNAWKFSSGQEVTRIAFYATREDDTVSFCVEDNGIGFDMAYAANLFQPFYRLHAGNEHAGSGIGLATVARIVQRHGGVISADSSPGNGARFCFTIGH